jgi:hypothetical protein
MLACFHYDSPIYAGIFMPSNENLIVCGGQDSTVIVFEWKLYLIEVNDENENKLKVNGEKKVQKKKDIYKNFAWATLSEITQISKKTKRRHTKKNLKVKAVNDENLNAKVDLKSVSKKHTSMMNIVYNEINTNPLDYIESILENKNESFCQKIFGSRENIIEVLEKERKIGKLINFNRT